jgi:diguanylate cyclase (GGDEF)-like protein
MSQAAVSRRVTFGDVLANREFRAMYIAQALSALGDHLARIAVAVLVFSRSHSALLTGLSYAISYLPWAIGGPLLAGYADRLPRRSVMVFADVARAILVIGIVIPHMPLAGLLVLVTAVALFEPPFAAARASMLPDVVGEGDHYAQASMLSNTTNNFSVVVGFAIGGAIIAALGTRTAILLDSATFAVSAILVRRWVQWRPAVAAGPRAIIDELRDGAQIVFGDAHLRWLVLVSWMIVAADVTTESVAVPYAAAHGDGALAAGLLTASLPLGLVVGSLFLARALSPIKAQTLMLPMALGAPAVLALTALNPPPLLAGPLWMLGGTLSAVQVVANRVFVASVVREFRGRAFGIAAAGISTSIGIGALASGAIAQRLSPAIGVADVALPAFAVICVLSARTAKSRNEARRSNGDERPDPVKREQEQDEVSEREHHSRPEPRIWAFITILALVALTCVPAFRNSRPVLAIDLPAWWLLLLFVIAAAAPLQFVYRRQPWSVQLQAVPVVIGLFFLSPLTLVLIRVLAYAISYGAIRRQPFIRFAYNVSAAAVITFTTVAVFRVMPRGSGVHAASWGATFVAVAADEVVSAVLVVIVVYLSDREWTWRQSMPAALFGLAVSTINTFLGLCTAGALSYDPSLAWAITVFVILSLAAVRTYHRLADRHAALDKLYAVARELGPIAAEPTDIAPALTQLRRIVKAETLELAMLGGEPGFATIITVFDQNGADGVHVNEREMDEDGKVLLGDGSAARRVTGSARRWMLRQRARGNNDRIAVPVTAGDRPLAVLTAQTRSGNVGNFDQSDIRLLEAAADQLSAALEKGRLVESLRRAATRDSLTKLANLDTLREFLATMLDGSTGGVLLLLDIDRFHEINDTLGHDAGDEILKEVARRLESAPTHGALVARVGGDQFALTIPGQAGSEVARLAALAVKSRVDGPVRFEAVSADLRITVGMSRSPEHGSDPATLLRRAEMAMTHAKGSASGIGEWEPSLERDGSRRLQLLAGLRQALTDNQLTVEFQPKILLGSGEVSGFESLVRWRHPELGPVSPAEFIPLAEASGLISALTSGVLRMSLDTLRRWHDAGYYVGIAVNISARSLDDPVLVGQVAAMLTASRVEPRWLTLEITESSVMENPARSLDVLLQLRSLGLRLSIDDFGTGYSSLHQLRGLPVHEVKIDKAFVDEVDGDGADRAVVRAIVELCDSLGLTTVAEGVERATQAYALESLGVTQVQGYFYGRPMPEPAATEWLAPRVIAAAKEPPSDMARG